MRAFSDHNTIANFRKDNPKPFLGFSCHGKTSLALWTQSLVAGDSTKLRAQNSKKIISTQQLNVTSLTSRLEEYNAALAKEDDSSEKKNIEKKI
jgi:hypothetical protein